jgi:nucleoside-diphosphate-sugar epimerase
MEDLKNKTILITGIGGFIGLRAAERALEQGMQVRGLEVSPKRAEKARALGIEVILGDTSDSKAAEQACQGVDVVLHTAAIVREGGSWGEFRRVNVGGTATLAQSACTAGAAVFVHLSSVMVYGFVYPDQVAEGGPLRGEKNPYCQTKIESEAEVRKHHRPTGMSVIIVRPGDVYGPGSNSWVVRPIQLMHRGRFALPNNGRGVMSHVYIDNLIDAVFAAIRTPAADGETFNVTDGADTTYREYFDRLADISGQNRPRSMPALFIKLVIWCTMTMQQILGRDVEATPAGVDFANRRYGYSIEKAKTLLGYAPAVDLDEGLRRTADWLDKNPPV